MMTAAAGSRPVVGLGLGIFVPANNAVIMRSTADSSASLLGGLVSMTRGMEIIQAALAALPQRDQAALRDAAHALRDLTSSIDAQADLAAGWLGGRGHRLSDRLGGHVGLPIQLPVGTAELGWPPARPHTPGLPVPAWVLLGQKTAWPNTASRVG